MTTAIRLYLPLLGFVLPTLAIGYGWDWVSSPRFPQVVEKIVEKHSGAPSPSTESG